MNLRFLSGWICILLMGISQAFSQCVPDTSLKDTILFSPATLQQATIGEPYEQSVFFNFLTEITIDVGPPFGSVTASLCEYSLDSIPNLPDGMKIACNTPDCKWKINFEPKAKNQGCLTLSGSPTTGVKNPNDSLAIYLTITPGLYDATTKICTTLPLPQELIRQYAVQRVLLPFPVKGGSTPVSLDLNPKTNKLEVYPNPAQGSTKVEYVLSATSKAKLTLTDITGRTVYAHVLGTKTAGFHTEEVSIRSLPKGLYTVHLLIEGKRQHLSKKLMVD